MLVCGAEYCGNVAAEDVLEGSITKTENGFKKIEKIIKVPANNVTVYNIMLDLYPNQTDATIEQRSIVANGIHTGDLYAQGLNED